MSKINEEQIAEIIILKQKKPAKSNEKKKPQNIPRERK